MANCPKCNAHLKITDWRQNCPHCGTNIMVYDMQERLMCEADIAEVQYYHFQKKIDNVKTAFVGNPIAITRIFTSILPIAALFLTLVNAKFSGDLAEISGKINFITVYSNIGKLGTVLGFLANEPTADKLFAVACVIFLLSIIALVLRFVFNALACSPKGKIRNYCMDAIILVTSIVPAVLILIMGSSETVSASLGLGSYLYIVLQIVNVVIDVIFFVKGFEIKHAQCYVGGIPIEEYFEMEKTMTKEEIRTEQYKRLKAIQEAKEAERVAKEAEKAEKEAAEKEAEVSGRK